MKLINLTKKYQGKYLTYYEARYINLDGKYKDYEFICNYTFNIFNNLTIIFSQILIILSIENLEI